MSLDVATIRRDFPLLEREVNGKRITYLDSASSAQKPEAVLDAMDDCYRRYYANIHRGVYSIAEESTAAYELARRKVAGFVNARSTNSKSFQVSSSMVTRLPGIGSHPFHLLTRGARPAFADRAASRRDVRIAIVGADGAHIFGA